MIKRYLIFTLTCLTLAGQIIASVTCWTTQNEHYSGPNTSCFAYSADDTFGTVSCDCGARCYNPPNNISARAGVWWSCFRTLCHGSANGWAVQGRPRLRPRGCLYVVLGQLLHARA